LQALSRLLAQHSQKAWQISRWQDASTLPWGDGWEIGIPRVAHGIPNRTHRLKGLGNAIVPQVAETLIREMARTLNV
jgi:site-specific DNA-cytosine methylase